MKLVLYNVVKIKTDEPSIKRLKALGYVELEDKPVIPVDEPDTNQTQADTIEDMDYNSLKALATQKGLEYANNIKKAELIELLKSAE